jgi:hypothetical protein
MMALEGAAEAGEVAGDLGGATGAEAAAAAAAAQIAAEAATAAATAEAAETAAAISSAEAVAEFTAAPFDIETLGASAVAAGGIGLAAGMATAAVAAAGIAATVIPAFIASHHQQPSATKLTTSEVNATITTLEAKVASTPSIKPILAMVKNAQNAGTPVYSVYNGKNTMIVGQLDQKALAAATAEYNKNPDVFKGYGEQVLTAMGLNSSLNSGALPSGSSLYSASLNSSYIPTADQITASTNQEITYKNQLIQKQKAVNTASAAIGAGGKPNTAAEFAALHAAINADPNAPTSAKTTTSSSPQKRTAPLTDGTDAPVGTAAQQAAAAKAASQRRLAMSKTFNVPSPTSTSTSGSPAAPKTPAPTSTTTTAAPAPTQSQTITAGMTASQRRVAMGSTFT